MVARLLIRLLSPGDSKGGARAGKYRGGMAMIRDWQILVDDLVCQWHQERAKFAPWGLQGGHSGSLAKGYHITEGKQRLLRKEIFFLKKGDLIRAVLLGAGGWGNPYEREANRVLEDVRNELVTVEAARREYGVVIDPENMQVDFEATRKWREEGAVKKIKKERGDLC